MTRKRSWGVPAALATGSVAALLVAGSAVAATPATVSCVVGSTASCTGMTAVGAHSGDSLFTSGTIGGKGAEIFSKNTASPSNPVTYIYLQVNPSAALMTTKPSTLYLTVDYYDSPAKGQLMYNYDSTIASAPVKGAYAGTASVTLSGRAQWKHVTWKLTHISFQQKENNSADLRIGGSPGVAVHEVMLSTSAPAAAPATPAASTGGKAALPKTGGSPLVPPAGLLALAGGFGLLRRRKAAPPLSLRPSVRACAPGCRTTRLEARSDRHPGRMGAQIGRTCQTVAPILWRRALRVPARDDGYDGEAHLSEAMKCAALEGSAPGERRRRGGARPPWE